MPSIPLTATDIVDDAGDNTNGQTWATAWTTLDSYIANATPTAGDVVVFGHNTTDSQASHSHTMVSGEGVPIALVSVTQGTGSVSGGGFVYQKATTAQITSSATDIEFFNSCSLYGLYLDATRDIEFDANAAGYIYLYDCTLAVGDSDEVIVWDPSGTVVFDRCTIDDSATGGTASIRLMNVSGTTILRDCSFTATSGRNAEIFLTGTNHKQTLITGCDFSAFTNATKPEIIRASTTNGRIVISNCYNSQSLPILYPSNTYGNGEVIATDAWTGTQPEHLVHANNWGGTDSSTSVTRTSGATVEGTAVAWNITTESIVGNGLQYCTPWIYANVGTTGSKTFDVYVSHKTQASSDVGDFTIDQVWLELEYKATASRGEWTFADDSSIADDTGSTWGGSPAYMQKLSITKTINTVGLARVRVCCAIPSMVGGDAFYVDPEVTVT